MNLTIGTIDATILVAYMSSVALFGLWMGRGQRDMASYLLGGRNIPWWGVLFSIVATETSTVTFLSIPGLALNPEGGNLLFLQLMMGYIIGRFLIVFLFLPHYFRGELFTAYQVLDRRFGEATRQATSLMFLVTRNLADGLRLFLTAILAGQVLGLDLWVCVTAIGLITILYTFVGGMTSVVWNDCIQFFVYVGGALLAGALIVAFLGAGSTEPTDFFADLARGWPHLTEYAAGHDKLRVFDWAYDVTRPYTFWSGLLGGVFVTFATHGTDQLMVQRYLSARSQKQAGRALALSGLVVCAQFALFLMIGVGLACFYDMFPPEIAFESNDQVFPAFIVHHLPVGVTGIVLAAVFSAAMSTLSSSLNSSAAAAVNDLYLPRRKAKPSPRHLLWVSRGLTVAFGLIQIGVGIAGQMLHSSVVESVMAIAAFASGAVLGVFFLAIITKRVTQPSALIGLVGGLAMMVLIVFFTDLAWPWYAVVGSSITVLVGCVASAFVGTGSSFDGGP